MKSLLHFENSSGYGEKYLSIKKKKLANEELVAVGKFIGIWRKVP
jgi:hypothetical protein